MNRSSSPKIALVIGAAGSFGAHAVIALQKHGWRIRGLARDPAAAAARLGPATPVEWIKGDAMLAADVVAAAAGASVIVHAANPPAYHNWKGLQAPMLESAIAAARCSGARIVLPGTVYNFAPDAGATIAEGAPQAPATRKGAIRAAMERRLEAVAAEGVRSLVLRAGDFFGPAAPNSALSWLINRRRGEVASVLAPGPRAVGHAFAYLPDLAETLALLLERENELAAFEVFHFAGHWLATGDALAASVRRVTGRPGIPLWPLPGAVFYALAPFREVFREMLEMRYLWRKPIGLDGSKLRAFLGKVPATPLDAAVAATLADMQAAATLARPIRTRRATALVPA